MSCFQDNASHDFIIYSTFKSYSVEEKQAIDLKKIN